MGDPDRYMDVILYSGCIDGGLLACLFFFVFALLQVPRAIGDGELAHQIGGCASHNFFADDAAGFKDDGGLQGQPVGFHQGGVVTLCYSSP